jgi:hypothetical protein
MVHPEHAAVPMVHEVVLTPFAAVVIHVFVQNQINTRIQMHIMDTEKVVDFIYVFVDERE